MREHPECANVLSCSLSKSLSQLRATAYTHLNSSSKSRTDPPKSPRFAPLTLEKRGNFEQYEQQGQQQQAITSFQAAIALHPVYADAIRNLADAWVSPSVHRVIA